MQKEVDKNLKVVYKYNVTLKQAKRRAGPGGGTRQLHHIHFVVTRN